jgi:3-oxoacyl-(acyl-carrier-protein) synthase
VDHIALPEGEASTAQPSKILHSLADKMAAAQAPTIAMLVACGSAIGDGTVSRWASSGSLFTASQPRGRVPGEGAAALLVTGMQHARSADGQVLALLDAVEEARRDSSIDESRRTDSALLGMLFERSLQRGGIASAEVGMVIADTGQRANRVFELMERLSVAMPQLDDKEDVLRVGAACGSCGAVPFITALALARHFAIERGVNVVCVSNEDPFQRVVGLVRAAT